ncbi:MAG: tRNA (adenosine(37)-N6)-threonylcarbamoyltransferase complex ATPase subunit type 1 TsaE [Chlorobium sp.]|jgi:tRNA threonylcarbamoyladenosine biosynthesis protein TsaE|uniref:tRNA (adenosine(37)-N6)-threonylcarbamoyltransferase complex ATPase subunit type 1 TsaE n=1 Tax=Chlorobium sp. TaxID=1095 RepID=UPI001DB8B3F4|nr:tRNA (adenosine(37)-N6)-threonylcarbamoyltransferase complex ATPase subunit type 1 TsaE [Chlorobium sp.]MBN1279798.1 tRNA (adenosine(37)-N6)-threonylcarbamoyltransferase complex ATPase subunit type 1 TsaE [Chlorobiaceae bacterium]MCF8216343.1 tRNA (adenosine(37)-N6)-threonylcarbamoyltransferase complex ATPase subunit type 1 TsaE [Chlorobium sp.]MCF8271245.1 tRNA (adenosine(37)-N6)-threonylcarbamoyltransferase complex ATPase subunit type 1 TsaE [Chlorobium sp.]MCF8287619.1 tRNA (adenosine(37)
MTEEFLSRSPEETREYARRFAATLQSGDRVCLKGQLGAGKTEFMKGIAECFNCSGEISSPTFSLFNIYHGSRRGEPVELHHFDLYRIERVGELDAIGFEEYLFGPHIAVVEWGDRFAEYRSSYTVTVFLDHAGDTARRIVITR